MIKRAAQIKMENSNEKTTEKTAGYKIGKKTAAIYENWKFN